MDGSGESTRLSGWITKPDVDKLRNVIEHEASAVAIDLKNVDLVDRDAVKFLAQRELKRNCTPKLLSVYPRMGHERASGNDENRWRNRGYLM